MITIRIRRKGFFTEADEARLDEFETGVRRCASEKTGSTRSYRFFDDAAAWAFSKRALMGLPGFTVDELVS